MQVYCDTAATTKPYMEVLDAVVDTMDAFYGNPSSEYSIGISAADMLRKARHSIAADLGAKDSEIYFTSGASEARRGVLADLNAGVIRYLWHTVFNEKGMERSGWIG